MFWRKKNLSSEEYEKLVKRIIGLEADVGALRTKIENASSLVSSLRGLVNRKIGKVSESDEEEENEKSLNNDALTEATRKKFGLA